MELYNSWIEVSKEYKKIIDDRIYEPILLEIINLSKEILKERFTHTEIDEQSIGESDFYGIETKNRLEAKTIFEEEVCKAISITNDGKWVINIFNLSLEIFDSYKIEKGVLKNSILYKEIVRELNKIKNKENVLLFFPMPITTEIEGTCSGLFGANVFSMVFAEIEKNNQKLTKNRDFYIVYPTITNKILLRNLKTKKKEYINYNGLNKYIKTINKGG